MAILQFQLSTKSFQSQQKLPTIQRLRSSRTPGRELSFDPAVVFPNGFALLLLLGDLSRRIGRRNDRLGFRMVRLVLGLWGLPMSRRCWLNGLRFDPPESLGRLLEVGRMLAFEVLQRLSRSRSVALVPLHLGEHPI